jgi:hypothetical protein
LHYAFFLERQLFSFLVLFSFVYCNKWLDPNKFLLEKLSCFSFAKNTPFFTFIIQQVFSSSATVFSFRILPWFLFRSCYIFASRCILTSGPSWYSSKELFQKGFEWCWKREKNSCKKVVQKGACVDRGLDFCMLCLMSFW